MSGALIGITGKRNVGKSTMADLLEAEYGFHRAHAFEGGKQATLAYFAHITDDEAIAYRMVFGDLKDKPSEYLPDNASPRFFMEAFGQFMGVQMGTAWTLEMEISRLRRLKGPDVRIVVESLVYEADVFKAMGGTVVRLMRPGFEGPAVPSDAVQALVQEHFYIAATTVEEAAEEQRGLMTILGIDKK